MTATRSSLQPIVLAAALGTLLATPATPAGAQGVFADRDERFAFGGVDFPAVADTFVVLRVSRWPDPRLGVLLHYSTPLDPSANLDIYVYPADQAVEAEFDEAVEGIVRYAEDRQEVGVTVDTTHAVSITDAAGRAHDGWRAATRLELRGTERPSLLYVFEKDGRFIKYRVTHATAMRERLEPHITAFLAHTLGEISGGSDP